jgi:hypothetical protein
VESQQRARFARPEQPKQVRRRIPDAAAQTPPPRPAVSRSPGNTTSSNPSFRPCHDRSPSPNAALRAFSGDDAARWGNGRRCNTPSNAPTTRRPPRERTRPQPPAGTPTRLVLSCDPGSRRSRSLLSRTHDKAKRLSLPIQYVSQLRNRTSPRPRQRLDLPPPSVADFRHGANLFAF